jgi:cystathionine gamma-synthase
MKLETLAVHAGGSPDPATGSVAPAIHLSTTFVHGPASEETFGYTYIRDKNPTQDRLEAAMSALEGGEDALAFSSGMGATAAFFQSIEPRSHVIIPEDVYVHVRVMAANYFANWQLEYTTADTQSLDAVAAAVRPNTKLIWAETPSNPQMKIMDIAGVAKIAQNAGACLLVDNTLATPVLQRPIDLGADVVLHSTTKYCGGHSDVQGGCLVFKKRAPFHGRLFHTRMVLGAVCSPFNSWLILRGLRSLPCRMERHSANAMAVAKALSPAKEVERVFYPGLPSHTGHKIAAAQMKQFGGMMSILVRGGWDAAVRVVSRVKLFQAATSLGGPESLIEHRASAEGEGSTLPKNLLRLSIGLEHPDDLIADLLKALSS